MRRWYGFILVLVLSIAVTLPPRLHAMAQDHIGHGAHHSEAIGHLMAAEQADHAADHACETDLAEFQKQQQPAHEHRKHAVCLTACACLPALMTPPSMVSHRAGTRLLPLQEAAFTTREPELPKKPPRSA